MLHLHEKMQFQLQFHSKAIKHAGKNYKLYLSLSKQNHTDLDTLHVQVDDKQTQSLTVIQVQF